MHIAYTPPEARERVAAQVRAFCAEVHAHEPPPRPRVRWIAPSWRGMRHALSTIWRHLNLVPANDR